MIVGDWAGREVAKVQPVKLAAMEGLGTTTTGAPFTVGGYYSHSENRVKGGFEIPKMLSLLAFHDPNATVKGLDIVPVEDRPGPINTIRYSFHAMVGIGTEVGRQPWIAYNVMRVGDAVTHAGGISILLGVGVLIYIWVIAMAVWLLRRLAGDAEHLKEDDAGPGASS